MPRAEAIRSISSSSRDPSAVTAKPTPHPTSRSAAIEGSIRCCRIAQRGTRPSCRTMRAGCSREQRWPATPSRPSWPQRLPQHRRPRPWKRSTSCFTARPCSEHRGAATLSLAASASSVAPCTRRRSSPAGDWERTSAAPTCSQRAARLLLRAHTMSNAPRARATSAQSPFCGRRAKAPRGSARQARRTGSLRHFRLLPASAPLERADRAPARAFCSAKTASRPFRRQSQRPSWRHSRSLPTTRTVARRIALAVRRACSDDASRRARVLRAQSNGFRTKALPKPSHS